MHNSSFCIFVECCLQLQTQQNNLPILMVDRIILIPINFEYCVNCSQHSWFSRHSQEKFQQQYELFRAQIQQLQQQVNRNIFTNEPIIQYFVQNNEIPQNLQKIADNSVRKYASCYDKKYQKYFDKNTNKVTIFPRIGAFEIYVNNILIFSKLKLKKFPNFIEIKTILRELAQKCLQEFRQASQDQKKIEELKCLEPQLVKVIHPSIIQPYKLPVASQQYKEDLQLLALSQKTIFKHSLKRIYDTRKSTRCNKVQPYLLKKKELLNHSTNLPTKSFRSNISKSIQNHKKNLITNERPKSRDSRRVFHRSQKIRHPEILFKNQQYREIFQRLQNNEVQANFFSQLSKDTVKKIMNGGDQDELQLDKLREQVGARKKQKGPFRRRHHKGYENAFIDYLIPQKMKQQVKKQPSSFKHLSQNYKNVRRLTFLATNYLDQSSQQRTCNKSLRNKNQTQLTRPNTTMRANTCKYHFRSKSLKVDQQSQQKNYFSSKIPLQKRTIKKSQQQQNQNNIKGVKIIITNGQQPQHQQEQNEIYILKKQDLIQQLRFDEEPLKHKIDNQTKQMLQEAKTPEIVKCQSENEKLKNVRIDLPKEIKHIFSDKSSPNKGRKNSGKGFNLQQYEAESIFDPASPSIKLRQNELCSPVKLMMMQQYSQQQKSGGLSKLGLSQAQSNSYIMGQSSCKIINKTEQSPTKDLKIIMSMGQREQQSESCFIVPHKHSRKMSMSNKIMQQSGQMSINNSIDKHENKSINRKKSDILQVPENEQQRLSENQLQKFDEQNAAITLEKIQSLRQQIQQQIYQEDQHKEYNIKLQVIEQQEVANLQQEAQIQEGQQFQQEFRENNYQEQQPIHEQQSPEKEQNQQVIPNYSENIVNSAQNTPKVQHDAYQQLPNEENLHQHPQNQTSAKQQKDMLPQQHIDDQDNRANQINDNNPQQQPIPAKENYQNGQNQQQIIDENINNLRDTYKQKLETDH